MNPYMQILHATLTSVLEIEIFVSKYTKKETT